MNITNEAVQALVLRAYEQGYETGYIVGRSEKDPAVPSEITWGDIYNEFKTKYEILATEVVDYSPFQKPCTQENIPFSILLYMKNGDRKRYSYTTKRLYPVHDEN